MRMSRYDHHSHEALARLFYALTQQRQPSPKGKVSDAFGVDHAYAIISS